MKKKRNKYHGLTGYRLHLRRFKFSSKEGIRTVKFPLEGKQELLDKFARNIQSDYEGLYGNLGLEQYEISLLADLRAKCDYYYKSQHGSGVFQLRLTKEQLAVVVTTDVMRAEMRGVK